MKTEIASLQSLTRNELVALAKSRHVKPSKGHTLSTSKSAYLIKQLAKQSPAEAGVKFEVPTCGAACTETPALPEEVKAEATAPAVAVEVVDAPAAEPVVGTPAPEAIDANVITFHPEPTQTELPAAKHESPADPAVRGFFKISRKTFHRQVAAAGRVVCAKNSMPVLACVLLTAKDGRVEVAATNLDVAISTSAIAQVEGAFSVAINARLLNDFVRRCASEFLMIEELPHHRIRISDIANKTEINGIGREEFPPCPELGTAAGFKVTGRQLKQVIAETILFASQDETRYILNGLGVDVKAGTVVATDGRRLCHAPLGAIETAPDVKPGIVILPSFGAQVISATIPEDVDAVVTFNDGNPRMSIAADAEGFSYRATIKLVDGTYPNYQQVIPQPGNRGCMFVVESKAVRPVIARLMVVMTEKANSIKCTFSTGSLQMASASPDHGQGNEPTPAEGTCDKPIEIGLSPVYFDDVFKSWTDEKVTIHVKDGNSPMIITAGAKLAVVMPVRLS